MSDKHDESLYSLYQKSRQEQPRERLDERIRMAAKRRLKRDKKRWIWGLSTAAVVVLSFSVVINVSDIDSTSMQRIIEKETMEPSEVMNDGIREEARVPESPAMLFGDNSARRIATPQEIEEVLTLDKVSQWAKSRSIEISAMRPALSKKSEAESVELSLVIPDLPTELDALLELGDSLTGEITPSGLVTVYAKDKLILTVDSNSGAHRFKAWPGSGILGVGLDWTQGVSRLQDCDNKNAYTVCSLSDQVRGMFEDNRLDHISWVVSRE
jgi:hypothetical protein